MSSAWGEGRGGAKPIAASKAEKNREKKAEFERPVQKK